MRFLTISLLLQVLALGYTSAQEAEKGAHNLECGVNNVDDATLTDCESLLHTDDIWAQATSQGFDPPDQLGDPVKIACYEGCCLFHRWEKWSNKGFNPAELRSEAKYLLGCGDTDKGRVNGRVSYGSLNETAPDNTRHTLCLGDTGQGPDCFTELIAKEAEEDKQRAAASST